jgi:electron transport complex protein RnfB
MSEGQICRDLQEFLDKLPGGFPSTESGSDINLLKYLFTPEEASVAVHLSMDPGPANVIHDRINTSGISMSLDELQEILDNMLRKGTLMPRYEVYTETHYCCTDTTSGGMITLQVDRLTDEFLEKFGKYSADKAGAATVTPKEHLPLRTVPIEKSISASERFPISSHDDIREIVKNLPGPFAVANCICRQMTRIHGGKCAVTDLEESCVIIGPDHARHYVDMGIGRFITREEVSDILNKAQDDGLILQLENSQRPEAVCCCCRDCCVFLTRYKKLPRPADMYLSNFYAEVDPELCAGCGLCVERCQMEARVLLDSVSSVDLDRCIGCGNCVVLCPSGANRMRKKEEETVPVRDKNAFYMNLLSSKQ